MVGGPVIRSPFVPRPLPPPSPPPPLPPPPPPPPSPSPSLTLPAALICMREVGYACRHRRSRRSCRLSTAQRLFSTNTKCRCRVSSFSSLLLVECLRKYTIVNTTNDTTGINFSHDSDFNFG
ncbi:hypothetical protein HZH66_001127 [Vespula vulgaris]|uniref:Uncharacterized protein n=1 Tax=Vespula vulgaris TaxID=7454 RepID=A0A834KY72_VESVU|nr:hypothetical protein HZH66_001127 [Vespula vulgaris]